jgi:hypothetical protein
LPAKITYYAIVDEFSSEERPGGVLRRVQDDDGQEDQSFTRNLEWEFSPLLYSYERGDGDNQFYEISEIEAYEIVARIRRAVGGDN